MDQSIKERLALLQKGDIPQGYRKTKAGITPIDWDDTIRAKDVFRNYTDKKHNGELEILASTQENGIVPRSQIGIDIQCSDEGIAGYKKVSQGDFVISLRSFQGGIEYSQYEGIVSPAYTVLKPIRSISDGYYQNYFKTSGFIQRLNSAVYGIRDGKQIGYQDFGDLYIHYPPIDEQKKIAEILAQCDKVIELYQCKIDELKKLKKACLNMVFPEKGSTMPQIRFPGFKGPWKKYQLGEISTFITKGTTPTTYGFSWQNDGIPFFRNDCIRNNIFVYGDFSYISEDANEALQRSEIQGNDILIAITGDIGKVGIVPASIKKANINQHIARIRTKSIEPYFVYQYLASDVIQNDYKKIKTGISMPQLSLEQIRETTISVPSTAEQRRIAAFLKEFDNLISLNQQTLGQWKQKKKFLMQTLLTGIVRIKC